MTLFSTVLRVFLQGLIYGYRFCLRPFLQGGCRFWPSCSSYAEEALKKHGVFKGIALTCGRLCRCHPWGGEGVDPVPDTWRFFGHWFSDRK